MLGSIHWDSSTKGAVDKDRDGVVMGVRVFASITGSGVKGCASSVVYTDPRVVRYSLRIYRGI